MMMFMQGCTYCESQQSELPGACLGAEVTCPAGSAAYTSGCPSPYTSLILVALLLYLAASSIGISPVPWAVNAEIYPLEVNHHSSRLLSLIWLPCCQLKGERKGCQSPRSLI